MSGTNHIAGGLLFTGIFASFWNINIFSDAGLLGLTVLGSVLPDIDHTKSPIGKLFWPLSRYLDTRYGHRTITHSLLFLVFISLFSYAIQRLFCPSYPIGLIFFFSAFSHLVLDMVTISGVPLFYPFVKNPCVIPGNPNFRLQSGSFRTEAIALLIFGSLLFTCSDLFAHGFWTSYNRVFGTLKHLYNESNSTGDFLLVHYDIIDNGSRIIDTALLIKSSEKKATLYGDGHLVELDNSKQNQHINDVKPIRTGIKYKTITVNRMFTGLEIDSLNSILNNRVVSGYIKSSELFCFHLNGVAEKRKTITMSSVLSPQISLIVDSSQTLARHQAEQIALELKQDILKWQKEELKWRNDNKKLLALKKDLEHASDYYQRNDLENQIIELQKTVQKDKPASNYTPNHVKLNHYEYLMSKAYYPSVHNFHVNISYPEIPHQFK
jgi:inner membrane protein